MGREVIVQLPSDLSLLDLAHRLSTEIPQSLGVPEMEAELMGNAVLEAVGNAMRHGNKESLDLFVTMRFMIEPNTVSVSIHDQGEGFDSSLLVDPTLDENLLKSNGRGFFLMRAFADSVDVTHDKEGGTVVTLTKSFSPAQRED